MGSIIQVRNISKQYRLGQVGTGTISHDLNRWWHRIRGKEDPYLKIGEENDRTKKGESDYSWALRDINFEVKRGEALGIIGRNGAGKSTLLKILSRTTSPSTGQIKIKGRVASLLEVGTGFHPELTGRENVFLNGAILGMSKDEINRKFDEIVDFSGVERYIDTPVKRYSSGMYVRLAFGVAAHLESEILIVDEVLAVGDAEFQKKCLGKMKDVSGGEGRTVLFVSHNMQAIANLCDQSIVLNRGKISFKGLTNDALVQYSESFAKFSIANEWTRSKDDKISTVGFSEIRSWLTNNGSVTQLNISLKFKSNKTFKPVFLAVDVTSIHSTLMQALPSITPFITDSNVDNEFEITIELPALIPGMYYADFWIGSHNSETTDFIEKAIQFEITDSPTADRTFPFSQDHGYIVPSSKVRLIS